MFANFKASKSEKMQYFAIFRPRKILTRNLLNQSKIIYIDVETPVMTVPESPYSGCTQSSPVETVPRVPYSDCAQKPLLIVTALRVPL